MNTNYLLVGTGCLLFGAGVANCQVVKPAPATPTTPTAPAQARGFAGKVIETIDAATYTYVRVDTGGERIWVAAPQFKVKVGDSAEIRGGLAMPNYHSKTLKRDFDVVYFTGGVVVNGVQMPQSSVGGQSDTMPQGHPSIVDRATPPTKVDLSGINKAAGGKTIEEILAGKVKLKGKQVRVRGKVVKYNARIMGKNWVHIQDGTGTAGSNVLLLTTATPVKVGDTLLATGTVVTDKDFGYGYNYAVMIDDAKVVIERDASQ